MQERVLWTQTMCELVHWLLERCKIYLLVSNRRTLYDGMFARENEDTFSCIGIFFLRNVMYIITLYSGTTVICLFSSHEIYRYLVLYYVYHIVDDLNFLLKININAVH